VLKRSPVSNTELTGMKYITTPNFMCQVDEPDFFKSRFEFDSTKLHSVFVLPTSCNTVLPEKLTVPQLFRIFPTFYGI
jgi:hypothetical protein